MENKAYIVAVDMGYGHQRAAFPLLDIATTPKEWGLDKPIIISANNYPNIPKKDKIKWDSTQKTYESISRLRTLPIIGKIIFNTMDHFQKIPPFYPKRDLSFPTLQTREMYQMIKGGLGKHLIDTLNQNPLPLLSTFFTPALFAEEHGYKGEIYCLCTDTDISRAWAPLHPEKSKIIYLAPNKRVAERLKLYGVRAEKIITTGFPLPKEALGEKDTLDILKTTIKRRIEKLDPKNIYRKKYNDLISLYLGEESKPSNSPLTLTFAVGGAGAQSEIGIKIIKSLQDKIRAGEIKLNLVAGISKDIAETYEEAINELKLKEYFFTNINIIYNKDKFEYFKEFNKTIIDTDILWTKPSELSFFAGLGLPIIMAPTIGSQEESNKDWLHMIGAGFDENEPEYTDEWLFDWLDSGWLANAAMNGFLNAPKKGTFHIEDLLLSGKKTEVEDIHFI